MKKTILIFSVFLSLLNIQQAKAQEKTISGTVTSKSENAVPLPGVNVIVKGTTKGVQTDFDGRYTIEASLGDVLEFSYVGLVSTSVTIGASDVIDVSMEESLEQLDDVVVTALGIQKSRKSLTYAAQDINADELSRVKQTNPINSLSGKVSGIVINRSASGVGGSVKVTLRGNNSFGNNQPLYVVDGIPLSNPTASQPDNTFGDINGGNRDGGDALSLINPDDIESLTVLKGASASALYGSAGLNGVILITTKKGKAGNFKASVSSNMIVENVAYTLDFNDQAQKNIDDFFNTGITNINSFSLSGGTENAQTYFSYSNSFASGILPTNDLQQHTFNIRETAKFFDGRLTANASVLASTQSIDNRAVSGIYFSPIAGVYNFESPGEQLIDYERFEELDTSRNIQRQRWFRPTSDEEQSPYWVLNRNASEDSNRKLLASMNLNFKIADWISLQTRGTYDQSLLDFERRIYATTNLTLAPANGRYIVNEQDYTQLYGDLIANINYNFNDDISLTANIGGSTTKTNIEQFTADSGTNGGLQFANVFSFQNFEGNPQVTFKQSSLESRINSVFISTTLGYKEMVYLDLTARNDWTSTLPEENNSFFYPSVGVTTILSEMFDFGDTIFGKIRGSYAEVGNGFGIDAIAPNQEIIFGGGGISSLDPLRPFPGTIPEPEKQRSFEVGTEWKFLNNRLGFEFGYYRTSTINQYFPFPVSSTIVSRGEAGLNSGDIVNSGFEGVVFGTPFKNDTFKWTTTVNFAVNRNEVKKIYDGTVLDGLIEPSFFTVSEAGVNTFASYLVEGGAFGDIYARVVRRDENGVPIVDIVENADGSRAINIQGNEEDPENKFQIDGLEKVGNANPDFTLGWNNSFEYKNFTLDFLIDGKFGGEVLSLTEAIVEGTSNNSQRETSNGTVNVVDLNGTPQTLTAQEYYGAVGGRNSFSGEYVYSATNVRLAELAIGYDFKLKESNFFTKIKVSLIGNNLFFFYKDAPYDPNISLSTGNALQGIDVLGLPSTRSTGANILLTF